MKETLVILAAGMGSRYGGLKQIDTVGNNGECIIDFTIYDAIKAGFKKLVLIIRKEHEQAFEDNLVKKIRPFIEVEYAYQDLNDIPEGNMIPEGREKPWGTTHALLACRHILKDDQFVICNADDYYGKDAFKKAIAYMNDATPDNEYAMVGYKLINTLSDNGTVTRGLCKENDEHYLTAIREVSNIHKVQDGAAYEEDGELKPIDARTPASMNFWIFKPNILKEMAKIFKDELPSGIANNPLKYEALLPNHVGVLVNENICKVKVLTSDDAWFGVTYRDDKPKVEEKLLEYKEKGLYPFDLWQKD